MDDLHGSAEDRLRQLDAATAGGDVSAEWLERHLRSTLSELAEFEPFTLQRRRRD